MSERDYNEPRRDYTSPEEDRYNRPNYETAEEYNKARQERENHAEVYENYEQDETVYNDYSYEKEAYANLGGQMIDENGAPVINYFAVQMVFAIVEILCCCCMNIGTMVLGIVALVFAVQANTAYKNKNAEEHKKKSKISSLLLIFGGMWMFISILFNVFVLNTVFEQLDESGIELDYMLDDLEEYEYYDEYNGEYTGTDDVPLVEGFHSYTYEGNTYSIPISFAEFEQTGWLLNGHSKDEVITGGATMWLNFCDSEENVLGMIQLYNSTEAEKMVSECDIVAITFEKSLYADDDKVLDVTLVGGIRLDSTYEEIVEVMGVPTYTYTPDDLSEYARYSWFYYGENGEYEHFEIMLWEGKIGEITIEVQNN